MEITAYFSRRLCFTEYLIRIIPFEIVLELEGKEDKTMNTEALLVERKTLSMLCTLKQQHQKVNKDYVLKWDTSKV